MLSQTKLSSNKNILIIPEFTVEYFIEKTIYQQYFFYPELNFNTCDSPWLLGLESCRRGHFRRPHITNDQQNSTNKTVLWIHRILSLTILVQRISVRLAVHIIICSLTNNFFIFNVKFRNQKWDVEFKLELECATVVWHIFFLYHVLLEIRRKMTKLMIDFYIYILYCPIIELMKLPVQPCG